MFKNHLFVPQGCVGREILYIFTISPTVQHELNGNANFGNFWWEWYKICSIALLGEQSVFVSIIGAIVNANDPSPISTSRTESNGTKSKEQVTQSNTQFNQT